jgi:hypothetical protein
LIYSLDNTYPHVKLCLAAGLKRGQHWLELLRRVEKQQLHRRKDFLRVAQ